MLSILWKMWCFLFRIRARALAALSSPLPLPFFILPPGLTPSSVTSPLAWWWLAYGQSSPYDLPTGLEQCQLRKWSAAWLTRMCKPKARRDPIRQAFLPPANIPRLMGNSLCYAGWCNSLVPAVIPPLYGPPCEKPSCSLPTIVSPQAPPPAPRTGLPANSSHRLVIQTVGTVSCRQPRESPPPRLARQRYNLSHHLPYSEPSDKPALRQMLDP